MLVTVSTVVSGVPRQQRYCEYIYPEYLPSGVQRTTEVKAPAISPENSNASRATGPTAPMRAVRFDRLSGAIAIVAVSYLLLVLTAWGVMYAGGDRWWLATVYLFAPRWILALPLIVLVPLAAALRRRALLPLLVAAAVLFGPVMGLCVPWRRLPLMQPAFDSAESLRVLTYNVAGDSVDPADVWQLVQQSGIDMIALQECPANFTAGWPSPWSAETHGGLLIASKYPLSRAEGSTRSNPMGGWATPHGLYATLELPGGSTDVCCVHLMTPRQGLTEVIDRKTLLRPSRSGLLVQEIAERHRDSVELRQWLDQKIASRTAPVPCIIAGDFNTPCESVIFRSIWAGDQDAFSTAGWGYGFSKFQPLRGWNYGARIDHVLCNAGWTPQACWVGPDLGSDHRPVIAVLARARK